MQHVQSTTAGNATGQRRDRPQCWMCPRPISKSNTGQDARLGPMGSLTAAAGLGWLGAAWGRCGTTASGKRPRTGPSGPVVSRIQEWCGFLKWSCCLCHVELGNNGDLINPPFWTGHRQEHHGGPGAEGRSTPNQRGFGLWLHFPDLPPMLQVVSFSPKST